MNDKNYKVTAKPEDFKGWESPIQVIADELIHKIERNAENNLMHTIKQSIGYEVDKEELLKALNYDRGQYEKGFEVAKRLYKNDLMIAKEYIRLLAAKVEFLDQRVVCSGHEDVPKEIYDFLNKED
jgi:hypothetical protein